MISLHPTSVFAQYKITKPAKIALNWLSGLCKNKNGEVIISLGDYRKHQKGLNELQAQFFVHDNKEYPFIKSAHQVANTWVFVINRKINPQTILPSQRICYDERLIKDYNVNTIRCFEYLLAHKKLVMDKEQVGKWLGVQKNLSRSLSVVAEQLDVDVISDYRNVIITKKKTPKLSPQKPTKQAQQAQKTPSHQHHWHISQDKISHDYQSRHQGQIKWQTDQPYQIHQGDEATVAEVTRILRKIERLTDTLNELITTRLPKDEQEKFGELLGNFNLFDRLTGNKGKEQDTQYLAPPPDYVPTGESMVLNHPTMQKQENYHLFDRFQGIQGKDRDKNKQDLNKQAKQKSSTTKKTKANQIPDELPQAPLIEPSCMVFNLKNVLGNHPAQKFLDNYAQEVHKLYHFCKTNGMSERRFLKAVKERFKFDDLDIMTTDHAYDSSQVYVLQDFALAVYKQLYIHQGTGLGDWTFEHCQNYRLNFFFESICQTMLKHSAVVSDEGMSKEHRINTWSNALENGWFIQEAQRDLEKAKQAEQQKQQYEQAVKQAEQQKQQYEQQREQRAIRRAKVIGERLDMWLHNDGVRPVFLEQLAQRNVMDLAQLLMVFKTKDNPMQFLKEKGYMVQGVCNFTADDNQYDLWQNAREKVLQACQLADQYGTSTPTWDSLLSELSPQLREKVMTTPLLQPFFNTNTAQQATTTATATIPATNLPKGVSTSRNLMAMMGFAKTDDTPAQSKAVEMQSPTAPQSPTPPMMSEQDKANREAFTKQLALAKQRQQERLKAEQALLNNLMKEQKKETLPA